MAKESRAVVLYCAETCNALVLFLDGEGPKFYRGRSVHLDADNGQERIGSEWKYEKARYRIVGEGKQFNLVQKIHHNKAEFERKKQAHETKFRRAESAAMFAWRDNWLRENPYPVWSGVDAILERLEGA